MALYVICAVRDSAIDGFGTPIFVRAIGEAVRSFIDECNREGSAFNAHPSDYELFQIGTYDDGKATIAAHAPQSLLTGKAAYRDNKE